MNNGDKAISFTLLVLVCIWLHSWFFPVSNYRQLDKIASIKQDWIATQAMPSRDGMRWMFIIFSEADVKRFEKEGLDSFGYQVFKGD